MKSATDGAENQSGGLWCHEVLARLQAFLDDELDAGTLGAVRAHVAVCDRCATFGATFAAATRQIRAGFERADADEGADAGATADRVLALVDADER